MAEITDPAEEFAILCRRLVSSSPAAGAEWLASQFETEMWSEEFYQILFTIAGRAEYLRRLIAEIDSASHIAPQIDKNISHILKAFRAQNLASAWKSSGTPHLGEDNVGPIMVLSAIVRPYVSYPHLSDSERSEVIEAVRELLSWLDDHQLTDQDFIRQALIDGLNQFLFRIERVHWLGYGYTLQSLKDVIGAYFALERGFVDDGSMPIVAATLKKVGEGIKQIYAKAGVAKEATDRADFLLRAYGAASMYANASAGGIAGLLTFAG